MFWKMSGATLTRVFYFLSLGIFASVCFERTVEFGSSAFLRNLHRLFAGGERIFNTGSDICCAGEQWEAKGFISSGDVFIDANTFFDYLNGTGYIAYDARNKKSYVSVNVTITTPLMPKPGHLLRTFIKDYEKGIMYLIDGDGSCSKYNTPKDMSFVCIPGNARKKSSGFVNTLPVSTYEFTTFQGHILNSASVVQKGQHCDPLVVSYTVLNGKPDSGSHYNAEVVDLRDGIRDPSIFVPPKTVKNR